jgi:hypothetical protein
VHDFSTAASGSLPVSDPQGIQGLFAQRSAPGPCSPMEENVCSFSNLHLNRQSFFELTIMPSQSPAEDVSSSPSAEESDSNNDIIDNWRSTSIYSALSSLFLSEKFSDLTIRCGHREFKAHRAIVCSQSPFFDKALTSGFQVNWLYQTVMQNSANKAIRKPLLESWLYRTHIRMCSSDSSNFCTRETMAIPAIRWPCHLARLS